MPDNNEYTQQLSAVLTPMRALNDELKSRILTTTQN